jgi:hypothetical protein
MNIWCINLESLENIAWPRTSISQRKTIINKTCWFKTLNITVNQKANEILTKLYLKRCWYIQTNNFQRTRPPDGDHILLSTFAVKKSVNRKNFYQINFLLTPRFDKRLWWQYTQHHEVAGGGGRILIKFLICLSKVNIFIKKHSLPETMGQAL